MLLTEYKQIKKMKHILLALLLILFISCHKEEGIIIEFENNNSWTGFRVNFLIKKITQNDYIFLKQSNLENGKTENQKILITRETITKYCSDEECNIGIQIFKCLNNQELAYRYEVILENTQNNYIEKINLNQCSGICSENLTNLYLDCYKSEEDGGLDTEDGEYDLQDINQDIGYDKDNILSDNLIKCIDNDGDKYGDNCTNGGDCNDYNPVCNIDCENTGCEFCIINPHEIGYYQTTGQANGVYILDNYAFIADGEKGLRIIDVNDLNNPFEIAYYDTPGTSNGIYIENNYAFIADGDNGLQIIDINDLNNLFEIGFYDTPGSSNKIIVQNNYVYIAEQWNGLRIIDISDVSNPTEVGFYEDLLYARDIYLQNNYAFIADGDNGLQIIDVNNAQHPQEVGAYNTPGDSKGIYANESYAFISDYLNGLQIIDIINLNNPFKAGSYEYITFTFDITVENNYAFLLGSDLIILDISDVSNPTEIGYYETTGNDIFIKDGYIFIADSIYGLHILSIVCK